MAIEKDQEWMREAVRNALLGEGRTSPNPMVGAIVVRGGRMVGKGHHEKRGEAHAEVVALKEAGELSKKSTLYVNLEPCSHTGRTPPCTETIIRSGVSKVIAAH